jgi:hypothetical protein
VDFHCAVKLCHSIPKLPAYIWQEQRNFNPKLIQYEIIHKKQTKQTETNSVAWVRERTVPTQRLPLVDEINVNFCGETVPRGQRDGSSRLYSRISRPSRYFFFQAAPQLYSRGSVDPVPDPLLLKKCGRSGNRTRTSGSVAKSSDH